MEISPFQQSPPHTFQKKSKLVFSLVTPDFHLYLMYIFEIIFQKVPSYLIPYICYWILLTSFLLLYTLFVMIVSVTKIHNTEDAADLLKANETSTSYPLPTNKIFEPSNVPHLILEFSLNNVALIAALFLVITGERQLTSLFLMEFQFFFLLEQNMYFLFQYFPVTSLL